MHFTSGKNFTMLLVWYQTIQNFRIFFSFGRTWNILFYIWRLCFTHSTHQRPVIHLKFHKVTSLRAYKKMLKIMIFGISKQFFCKNCTWVSWKMRFFDSGHVFWTRQCSTRQLIFFGWPVNNLDYICSLKCVLVLMSAPMVYRQWA